MSDIGQIYAQFLDFKNMLLEFLKHAGLHHWDNFLELVRPGDLNFIFMVSTLHRTNGDKFGSNLNGGWT